MRNIKFIESLERNGRKCLERNRREREERVEREREEREGGKRYLLFKIHQVSAATKGCHASTVDWLFDRSNRVATVIRPCLVTGQPANGALVSGVAMVKRQPLYSGHHKIATNYFYRLILKREKKKNWRLDRCLADGELVSGTPAVF